MPQVIELFAGVGGFRVGLDRANQELHNQYYDTIWANQWEPSTRVQHAWRTYERVFGEGSCVNQNISEVEVDAIPDHDMLVGGFPCQDYSVARTLNQSRGLEGKKGVLWWEIHRIVRDKGQNAPTVLFLENVDRLVNSPAKQRGRDFAIILQSLSDLGYSAEWRIINAADYGMPQRRKRTYILAYRNDSPLAAGMNDATDWIFNNGVFASAFPVVPHEGPALQGTRIKGEDDHDLADITEHFNAGHPDKRVFESAGVMTNGVFYTCKVEPQYDGHRTTLGEIVAQTPREEITEDFYIPDFGPVHDSWVYLKGAKHEERVANNGYAYMYNEGPMHFPDPLDVPSRTIITSEGGSGPSRFKHVIEDPVTHRLRRLVPTELEQLDMFPVNHTQGESNEKRAFFMGNALVCGIVEKVGLELAQREW